MNNIFKYIDWYLSTESRNTTWKRLLWILLFIPLIPAVAITFCIVFLVLCLASSISIIWSILFSLPYWICTGKFCPQWLRKISFNIVKDLLEN